MQRSIQHQLRVPPDSGSLNLCYISGRTLITAGCWVTRQRWHAAWQNKAYPTSCRYGAPLPSNLSPEARWTPRFAARTTSHRLCIHDLFRNALAVPRPSDRPMRYADAAHDLMIGLEEIFVGALFYSGPRHVPAGGCSLWNPTLTLYQSLMQVSHEARKALGPVAAADGNWCPGGSVVLWPGEKVRSYVGVTECARGTADVGGRLPGHDASDERMCSLTRISNPSCGRDFWGTCNLSPQSRFAQRAAQQLAGPASPDRRCIRSRRWR